MKEASLEQEILSQVNDEVSASRNEANFVLNNCSEFSNQVRDILLYAGVLLLLDCFLREHFLRENK